jgi:hypothetical protein
LWACLLPLAYLPTLWIDFDFNEDGAVVHSAAHGSGWGRTIEKSWHEYQITGPFRPVTWAHWIWTSHLCGDDPVLHRGQRLVWCAFAAWTLCWFLWEMGLSLLPILLISAAAMWSPSRAEIWIHLGMPEAFGMPYSLLALIGVVRASRSRVAWRWDLFAALCFLLALGVKNTYLALAPALLWLRLYGADEAWAIAWKRHRLSLVWIVLLASLPVIHFLTLKLWPRESHFETGLSWQQTGQYLEGLLRAACPLRLAGCFLGLSLLLALLVIMPRASAFTTIRVQTRVALVAGLLLVLGGVVVYLPWKVMYGRYTMPAVWGVDLLMGMLLMGVISQGTPRMSWATCILFCVGLLCELRDVRHEQDHLYARSAPLWQMIRFLENECPEKAIIALINDAEHERFGDGLLAHLSWHVHFRRRADLNIVLAQKSPPARADMLASGSAASPAAGYVRVASFKTPSRRYAGKYDVHLWQRERIAQRESE